MAVLAVRLAYRQPARAGERVLVANWIVRNDGRLRATRRFEMVRASDARVLLDGEIDYVCIEISSGRPRRLPPEFRSAYAVLPAVAAALRAEERESQTGAS
jgi:acyl-CoA thioester hydrolase